MIHDSATDIETIKEKKNGEMREVGIQGGPATGWMEEDNGARNLYEKTGSVK